MIGYLASFAIVRRHGPRRQAPQARRVGILSEAQAAKRAEIIELLTRAYWMETETVLSYLANAANLDGIRAEEIAEALDAGRRGGARPRAQVRRPHQGPVRHAPRHVRHGPRAGVLQPGDPTDVVGVIRGVIEAEAGAIEHYNRIIEACDGVDWATQDMVIEILRDEENHLRTFERYLKEFAS